MFNKLQNRLKILIMTVISVLMIVVFTVIYGLTYLDVQNENQRRLQNAAPELDIFSGNMSEVESSSKNASDSFSITVNRQGQITGVQSSVKLEDSLYARAASLALNADSPNSKIKLGGKTYIFRMDDKGEVYFEGGNADQSTIWLDSSNVITFLDITQSQRILTRLGITFGITAVVMLFVIYGISTLFARRSIAPIELAYTKQKQFIADASHELKTPIASISANTEVLLANKDDSIAGQEKWLRYIKLETEKMNKLVKNLLYLAKTDETTEERIRLPFSISDTVSDSVLSMEAIFYEKGLTLSCEIEPGLIVNGDSDMVAQVITILMDNASKYTSAGGSVDVRLYQNKHQAIFSISNTAKGIAKEDESKFFDRFYRTDPARKHNGSYGLGLSIAKSIIEGMDGKIYASCVDEECVTFVFELNKC